MAKAGVSGTDVFELEAIAYTSDFRNLSMHANLLLMHWKRRVRTWVCKW